MPSLSAPKAYQGSQFIVALDSDGNIKIGVGVGEDEITHEIYPNPASGSYYGSN